MATHLHSHSPAQPLRCSVTHLRPVNGHPPAALRLRSREERPVIEWHRIKDFQRVSLKLLAEQLLLGCPAYASAKAVPLYLPGELEGVRMAFRTPVALYASPNNPGAAAAAERLRVGMGGALRVVTEAPILERRRLVDVDGGGGGGGGGGLGGGLGGGHHHVMLLYLNVETHLGARGEALAGELRRARAAEPELPVVMLHENDAARGGCDFGRFFEATPHDLIQDGLYRALALASYPGAFWPVSVALVAKALGAVERRRRRRVGGGGSSSRAGGVFSTKEHAVDAPPPPGLSSAAPATAGVTAGATAAGAAAAGAAGAHAGAAAATTTTTTATTAGTEAAEAAPAPSAQQGDSLAC